MTNIEIINLLKQYRTNLQKFSSPCEQDYQSLRSFLKKNRAIVQRILIAAGTLRYLDIAPPPLVGGYMMRNVNPMDLIFDMTYGPDACDHLSDVIEQAIGIIEADEDFSKKLEAKPKGTKNYDVWALIHPSISEVSKKRMKDGYYADAVEAACKALNARVRDIVIDQTGEELDGAKLMQKAFSPSNPIIRIASPAAKSGQDTQQGYMNIFSGVMTGIRNPKAHDNETITIEDAYRKLILISILMYKIDGRIITE